MSRVPETIASCRQFFDSARVAEEFGTALGRIVQMGMLDCIRLQVGFVMFSRRYPRQEAKEEWLGFRVLGESGCLTVTKAEMNLAKGVL